MTEKNMRRFGLKLLLGGTLTVLLVASIRQQWNSSVHKQLIRKTTPDEASYSKTDRTDQQYDEIADYNNDIKEKTERVDAAMEENMNNVDDNSVIISRNDLEVNNTQKLKTVDAAIETIQEADGDSVLTTLNNLEKERIDNSETPIVTSLSSNETENSSQAMESDDDIPDYGGNDHSDPNWRTNKFSYALYDDEEDEADSNDKTEVVAESNEEDNGGNDEASIIETSIENTNSNDEIEQTFSQSHTSDDNKVSLFSWLDLTKYLPFGNSPYDDDNEDNEVYYNEDNTSEEKQAYNVTAAKPDLNAEADTVKKEIERNKTGNSVEKVRTAASILKDYPQLDANEKFENIFKQLENESQNIPSNLNSDELPFNVNGINKANYDDNDDFNEPHNHEQTDENEDEESIKQQIKTPLSDISNNASDPDTPKFEVANLDSQDRLIMSKLWDELNQTLQTDSLSANKPDGVFDFHNTHQNQQQSLLYQKQEAPIKQHLSQQQHIILKALLPPHLLDIIFSQNFDSPYWRQLPAKMQDFIHQNIHRIDQDFEPQIDNKIDNIQTRTPAYKTFTATESLSYAIRGLKNGEIEQGGNNFQTNANDQNEDYDNVDDSYESSENKLYDDDGDFNGKVTADVSQNDIYTPVPEIAVYDNPRPLTDEQFALFRTRSYNTGFETKDILSEKDQNVTNSETNEDNDEVWFPPQQISKPETGKEDETLTCPRDVQLSKNSHPVTALVAFSDEGTQWILKILEQLTGLETDSIYNIMAQLKIGNVASVYQMGRKIAIESHIASVKNFDRAIVVIKNPFSVDLKHKTFRPFSVDWQKTALWNLTYSTWITSSLPLHVMTYEDLVERPLSELMKLTEFLSNPDVTISYKCAMRVALDPPDMIDDVRQITGIYNADKRRMIQNIDYLIRVAQTTHPHVVTRLNSYKALSGTQMNM